MSIRSQAYSALAYRGQVSPQLNDVLRRNGMTAALAVEGNQYKLLVQGHDSPMMSYDISQQQFAALAEGGTNYSNKKAFNVFNGIVSRDFDVPSSFVAARNVNSRVVMGLHGVRDSVDVRPHAFGPGFLEWGARQPGFHIRRFGDVPMVVEHADGRLRPGELKAGDYGYYYKGQQKQETDPLKDMQTYFPPVQVRPRPAEPAIPYKEAITSDVYFTDEKWQEVLSSHGIIVDADKKTLTIQSTKAQQDFVYDLTDDEVKKLTQNTLKGNSVQNRLNIINRVIGGDFEEPVTKAMLNSKERIAISLKPEVEQELMLKAQQASMQHTVIADPLKDMHQAPSLNPNDGYVDGSRLEDYNVRKGWFREGKHGREVEVGDIWVEKAQKAKEQTEQQKKDNAKKQDEGKEEKLTYRMCAVINGEVVAHEISKKQYDKFMAVDDYQRQRMMSKVFGEVDMKTRPEMRQSFNLGAFMAAGLTAVREATFVGADIAHNVEHIKHPHSGPELYQEVHGTGRIYVKPGVDSPQNIAERAFEAGLNAGIHEGMGRGR